jgi:hypothetical protein
MRGRPRKFSVGDVVRIKRPNYGVVVGYQPTSSNQYAVMSVSDIRGAGRGATSWLDSQDLQATGHRAPLAARMWRALNRHGIEQLGCGCLCCGPHYSGGFEPEPEE